MVKIKSPWPNQSQVDLQPERTCLQTVEMRNYQQVRDLLIIYLQVRSVHEILVTPMRRQPNSLL